MKSIEEQNQQNINNVVKHELYVKNRNKLAKNFYKKMNNFLLDMIKRPIIINNYYYQPKEKNSSNSFRLYKFQTDRERVGKLMKMKNQEKKKYSTSRSSKSLHDKIMMLAIDKEKQLSQMIDFCDVHYIAKNYPPEDVIRQPSMKFKPRNDLERIIDSINLNQGIIKAEKYNKIKNQYGKQLFKMEQKENKELENREKNEKEVLMAYDNDLSKNNKDNDINKKADQILSKINLSNTVKNITEKYHSRTYFNAIEQTIIRGIQSKKLLMREVNNNNKKPIKYRLKKNYSSINFYPNHSYRNKKNKSLVNNSLSKSNFEDSIGEKTRRNLHETYDENYSSKNINSKDFIIEKVQKLNDPGFYKNQANKLDDDNINAYDNHLDRKAALKILKEMSFIKAKLLFSERIKQSNINNKNQSEKELSLNNKIQKPEDELYVVFKNNIYNKSLKKDMQNLGKAVLQNCHFINTKYDKNENNHLKKGSGKLMMTNGMSIKEFFQKHDLPDFNQ